MPKTSRDPSHTQADTLAAWLDDRFAIPGTDIRFGLDPIIGLIPGAGDWLSGMVSTYFIILGVRDNVAPAVLGRMGFNILLDIFVGSIPLLGDIFDVGWKSNRKNARLLNEYGKNRKKTERHSRWVLWGTAILLIALAIALLALITWLIAEILQAIF